MGFNSGFKGLKIFMWYLPVVGGGIEVGNTRGERGLKLNFQQI